MNGLFYELDGVEYFSTIRDAPKALSASLFALAMRPNALTLHRHLTTATEAKTDSVRVSSTPSKLHAVAPYLQVFV